MDLNIKWKNIGMKKISNKNKTLDKEVYCSEKRIKIKKYVTDMIDNTIFILNNDNVNINNSVFDENQNFIGEIIEINFNQIKLNVNKLQNKDYNFILIETDIKIFSICENGVYIDIYPFDKDLKYFSTQKSCNKENIYKKNENTNKSNALYNIENTVLSVITLSVGFVMGNYIFNYIKM